MGITATGKEGKWEGPTWRDVYELVRAIEKQNGIMLELTVHPASSVNGLWGLRVRVREVGSHNPAGYGSFGPGFPGNGKKTLSAAFHHALMEFDTNRVKHWLDAHNAPGELPF